MIGIVRTLILLAHVHATWPDAPIERAAPAVAAAVQVGEETGLPPEVLVAIAHHESDFQPAAVSWRAANGQRLDRLAVPDVLPRGAVCGYLQSMTTTRLGCLEATTPIGGMRAGARELVEWLGACRGDLRCALVGYAGGNRAVTLLHAGTLPRGNFADLFLAHARRLGWTPHTKENT
jgi:hypothetical protein